ncbi:zf-HC2 domain-containing protein [Neisseria weaveri]|uniref:Putative zinc-finger domain-containing protein n=1 Tax=Neisseria weaveri TaxID=28091 RepID=A0A3S4ZE99_9NEIS|nr:zf-HC2 domain-containing protein [Neisseria weaveri]EGV35434.1 hypothetical protein l13_14510 [Neisseria weaveri ATCC 51223]EGV37817.1 hypothetical protein l11_10580 [Neisseria weaveri LMG 5135]SAY50405.1 Uncharacterised protein [Neisseria weaveri]VEJ51814.1 Uncharacterised protein [Neisseria weaveri]
MLKCKDACRLVSESQDRPLTKREKIALRLHLLICRYCKNYEKQLNFIREQTEKWRNQNFKDK